MKNWLPSEKISRENKKHYLINLTTNLEESTGILNNSLNDKQELPVLFSRKPKNGGPFMKHFSTHKVIDYIRYGSDRNATLFINKTYPPAIKRSFAGIKWRGTSDDKPNIHTGLICIGIRELTNPQRVTLFEAIKNDSYTTIVFANSWQNGLWIIIKTDCKASKDEKSYKKFLQNHYTKNYGITYNQFIKEHKNNLSRNYPLNYDPNVYYNPNSTCLTREKIIDQELIVANETNPYEPNTQDDLISTPIDADYIEVEGTHSIPEFNPIYYIAKLPDIQKMCAENFLQLIGDNYELAATIQSTTKWNQANKAWELNYFTSKNKKIFDSVDYVYDVYLDTTLISAKNIGTGKSSKRNVKAPIPDVCQSLLTLLDSGELEQGNAQRQLAEMHQCSYETIRDRMKVILKNHPLIHDTTGKSIELVKRKAGFTHFLSLRITC